MIVPGPLRIPTPAGPNLPIGAASSAGLIPIRHCETTRVASPGQTNALGSNQRNHVGFEILPSLNRSGCCVRDKPEPLPDGSTLQEKESATVPSVPGRLHSAANRRSPHWPQDEANPRIVSLGPRGDHRRQLSLRVGHSQHPGGKIGIVILGGFRHPYIQIGCRLARDRSIRNRQPRAVFIFLSDVLQCRAFTSRRRARGEVLLALRWEDRDCNTRCRCQFQLVQVAALIVGLFLSSLQNAHKLLCKSQCRERNHKLLPSSNQH